MLFSGRALSRECQYLLLILARKRVFGPNFRPCSAIKDILAGWKHETSSGKGLLRKGPEQDADIRKSASQTRVAERFRPFPPIKDVNSVLNHESTALSAREKVQGLQALPRYSRITTEDKSQKHASTVAIGTVMEHSDSSFCNRFLLSIRNS